MLRLADWPYTRGTSARDPRAMTLSACPVSHVDPFAPAFLADPYPELGALRTGGPVFYSPVLDMWIVTRHADIEAIFHDHETFSATIVQDPIHPPADEARAVLTAGG